MSLYGDLQKRRIEILNIAAKHGATDVRVFGSVARGEGTEASDVDLLVTMEPGRSLFDLMDIKDDLERLLGRQVEVLTEKSISEFMIDNILAQAKRL